MTDVVTGAIIGAAAVVVGGIGAGVIDLIARRQDRSHDTTERAAEREAGASARREEREAVERAAWRERAAVTFGQVLEFATDVQPANSTALIQTAEEAQAKFERLEVRWEALRAPLGVLIIGLPTTAERDLAEDVLERLRGIYNALSWILRDIAQGRGTNATTVLDLQREWEEASAKLRELREAIQEASR